MINEARLNNYLHSGVGFYKKGVTFHMSIYYANTLCLLRPAIVSYLLLVVLSGCNPHTPDNMESTYTPFATSTIKIILQKDPLETFYGKATSVTNIPREGVVSELLPLTAKGTYYLNLSIDRPHAATFTLEDEPYIVIVIPDDTTRIVLSGENDKTTVEFTGRFSEVNHYYLSKKKALGYVDMRYPLNHALNNSATHWQLANKIDSIAGRESRFLENYPLKEKLPHWFYQYESAEITYAAAGFKTQIPNYNAAFRALQDNLPKDYFDFLQTTKINSEEALFSSKYLWFLDYYFTLDLPYEKFRQLSGYPRLEKINDHITNRSKDVLNEDIKKIYYKYLLSGIIRYMDVSLPLDSLAKSYEVTDHQELVKLQGTKLQVNFDSVAPSRGDRIPDFYLADERDSLYAFQDFENSILYVNFWATWCKPCIENFPALNTLITEYKTTQEITFLNICLESKKETWKMVLKKEGLLGTNLFVEGQWTEKIKSSLHIRALPRYILVDKGNILWNIEADKAPDVKAQIEQLLKH